MLRDLDFEYRIMTELLTSQGKYQVVDMLKQDQREAYNDLCTHGDFFTNVEGVDVSLETVLSVKEE